MIDNNGINTYLIEEQARSLHFISGEHVTCVDMESNTLFSFKNAKVKLKDQSSLSDLLVLMKEKQPEIMASNHLHFLFLSPDSVTFYVQLFKDINLYLILGPLQDHEGTEKLQNLVRLCYWLFQSNDTLTIPQPKTYALYGENKPQESPDISLVHIYYEQEFPHFPLEHAEYLMSKMLAGDIKAVQGYFDSNSNMMNHGTDHIKLAKDDHLRSFKNHLITACAAACFCAINGGVEDEYARSLADQYIRKIENTQSRIELTILVREIFLKFTSSIMEFANPNYSALVKSTIHYMHTHFFEKLTLNDVARKIGKSSTYISNKVKKETGMSFNENLNQIRIKESKQLLIHTQKSIHDIAIVVGFDYQNHFAKIFKKIVGVTPFQYRNKRGLF